MIKTETLDDIDLLTDEIDQEIKVTKSHSRQVGKKNIPVKGTVEIAKDNYKKAKKSSRNRIAQYRRDIRSHKILIKSAKYHYKLVKLNEK